MRSPNEERVEHKEDGAQSAAGEDHPETAEREQQQAVLDSELGWLFYTDFLDPVPAPLVRSIPICHVMHPQNRNCHYGF